MRVTKRVVQGSAMVAGVVGAAAIAAPDTPGGRAIRRLADRLARDVRYLVATAPGILYRLARTAAEPGRARRRPRRSDPLGARTGCEATRRAARPRDGHEPHRAPARRRRERLRSRRHRARRPGHGGRGRRRISSPCRLHPRRPRGLRSGARRPRRLRSRASRARSRNRRRRE